MTVPAIPSLPLEHLLSPEEILKDYRLAYCSRQASLVGRREVMSGKAKFGIFGDGKEVPQLAMARVFRPGDWRSGYYRDQTFVSRQELGHCRSITPSSTHTPMWKPIRPQPVG